jgi:hypothetical protein
MKNNNNYIFVLFSPGIGGNHLTNLLSISLKLYCDFPTNKKDIISIYNKPLVHSTRKNLQKDTIKKIFKNKEIKDTILCGHLREYLHLINLLKNLNKKFITITGLNSSSIKKISPRINLLGDEYSHLVNVYYYSEQSTLYESRNIAKLLESNNEKIIEVQLSNFLSANIIPLLNDIGTQLGYTTLYDLDFCQELHTIWLANNNIV